MGIRLDEGISNRIPTKPFAFGSLIQILPGSRVPTSPLPLWGHLALRARPAGVPSITCGINSQHS